MSNVSGEAVREIAELAKQTLRAEALEVDGFAREVMVVGPDGSVGWRPKPPANIRHRVESVYDLVRLVEAEEHRGSLWISPDAVTYVLDNEHRYDRVTCDLATTDQFKNLTEMSQAMLWRPQKDLVWLLQTTFDGCVPADLVKSLQYLKFSRTSEGHATVTHGSDSMGNQVAAACRGGNGEIPEYVNCDAPVYITPGFGLQQKRRIRCRLLIDTDEQRLCLMPLPGELDKAVQSVLSALAETLRTPEKPGGSARVKCPVYLGAPG